MRTEIDVALADRDASADELRRMGEAVRETVDRCERLIESLLMLARSEARAGREEPIDLAALAADCVTDMLARAREHGIELRDDLAPAWVRGDPSLLERMIANLVDNAVRYNVAAGFLAVSSRTEGGRVRLVVANSGPHVDPAAAQTLTEPFRRLGSIGGLGLGLSIARSVALAYGGTLEVAAPDAGGLVVSVELPAALVLKKTPRAFTKM
jgi:signal transduction histidine kinase